MRGLGDPRLRLGAVARGRHSLPLRQRLPRRPDQARRPRHGGLDPGERGRGHFSEKNPQRSEHLVRADRDHRVGRPGLRVPDLFGVQRLRPLTRREQRLSRDPAPHRLSSQLAAQRHDPLRQPVRRGGRRDDLLRHRSMAAQLRHAERLRSLRLFLDVGVRKPVPADHPLEWHAAHIGDHRLWAAAGSAGRGLPSQRCLVDLLHDVWSGLILAGVGRRRLPVEPS